MQENEASSESVIATDIQRQIDDLRVLVDTLREDLATAQKAAIRAGSSEAILRAKLNNATRLASEAATAREEDLRQAMIQTTNDNRVAIIAHAAAKAASVAAATAMRDAVSDSLKDGSSVVVFVAKTAHSAALEAIEKMARE